MRKKFIRKKVGEIKSAQILQFIEDIENVTGVKAQNHINLPLQLYLKQCFHPDGGSKFVKIPKDNIPPDSLLLVTIKKLEGEDLSKCLHEAVLLLQNGTINLHLDRKVYVFLNDIFNTAKKKNRKSGWYDRPF